jgi:hypothetical protein
MFKFSNKPLSAWGAFVSGLKLYINAFSKIWYILLFYWITTLYLLFGYARGIMPVLSFTADSQVKFVNMPMTVLFIFGLVGFLFFLLGSYLKWVAFYQINKSTMPEVNPLESFSFVGKRYFVLLGNYLLISIMMFAVSIPFVVPTIFLGILWMFCAPAILFDKQSATSAIKESSSLVWGKWWQSFYSIVIPLVLFMVTEYGLPYYFIGTGLVTKLSGALLSLVADLIILPIIWSIILVKYRDLKLRKIRQL